MRALREKPRQRQRQTHMPLGKPTSVPAPRGMRHRRSESDGIHYGGLGQRPSAEVQEAGGGLLPRGSGARSPRKPSQGNGGAKPPKAHPIGRRRARCAPYGKGRASGNVRRTCLVVRSDVSVFHQACATEVQQTKVIQYGVWGSAPARRCRRPAGASCRGVRGREAPERLGRGNGGAQPPKALAESAAIHRPKQSGGVSQKRVTLAP